MQCRLLLQDVESHDSQSVYDAEEEGDYTRPLWRRGYFRRLILPFCLSMAMFVAAALVFRLTPHLVKPCPLKLLRRASESILGCANDQAASYHVALGRTRVVWVPK